MRDDDTPYPPHRALSPAEARAADLEAASVHGVPSLVLMEHAGRGLAVLVARRRGAPGPVVVVCGPGATGGDGFACARFLASWGLPLRVFATDPARAVTSDAAIERSLVARDTEVTLLEERRGPEMLADALADASVVVDALFGVGFSRGLSPRHAALVDAMNACGALRVAADVPSGLDADLGVARPRAVRAHVTAAMGFVKRGCTIGDGVACSGELVEIDIGLPRAVHARHLRV